MRSALIVLALATSSCALADQPPRMINQTTADWRAVATGTDRERLRGWRATFVQAVAAARRSGRKLELDRGGALFQADAALGGGPIPNGDYRCSVTKVGARSDGMLDFVAYPAFTCRISQQGPLQHFRKLSGSQRQVGMIFPADPLRQVFLGTLVLGDEGGALQYGIDEKRNVAGYVERIGPARWRLIMPRPHFESQLDIMELIPVASGAR